MSRNVRHYNFSSGTGGPILERDSGTGARSGRPSFKDHVNLHGQDRDMLTFLESMMILFRAESDRLSTDPSPPMLSVSKNEGRGRWREEGRARGRESVISRRSIRTFQPHINFDSIAVSNAGVWDNSVAGSSWGGRNPPDPPLAFGARHYFGHAGIACETYNEVGVPKASPQQMFADLRADMVTAAVE